MFRTRIQQNAKRLNGLEPTNRDVAIALEVLQAQCDILEEMEDADFAFEKGVLIEVNGKRVQFDSVEEFTTFAAGIMHNG